MIVFGEGFAKDCGLLVLDVSCRRNSEELLTVLACAKELVNSVSGCVISVSALAINCLESSLNYFRSI